MKEEVTNFADILTSDELVTYLSNSADRLRNSGYIYHYTTLPVVVKMLSDNLWHLGNAKNMNDQLEYKNGDPRRWKNIFFSSFMTENKESIAMWSMYAQPWEKGIKIAIPSKIAREWISNITEFIEISTNDYLPTERKQRANNNEFKLASVAYCNTDSLTNKDIAEKTTWSNATNKNLQNVARDSVLTGYIKDQAWSYEKEIRIRGEINNNQNFERIAIELPEKVVNSMIITASPLFEGDLETELYKEINRHVRTDKSLFKGRLNIKTICQKCKERKIIIPKFI